MLCLVLFFRMAGHDLAKEEVKNQLGNPESFMIRAIENRLTTEELAEIGVGEAVVGAISSMVGIQDETSAINGMDVPVAGQVLGVSFSAGHSGMETIKEKVEFKTEKKTSQEESNKQISNKEKQ